MPRLILIFILFAMMVRPAFAQNIKLPNVSGKFYDADPAKLAHDVAAYIQAADLKPSPENVQMLIAPHAGYVFSGPVAGYSFKAVSAKKFKTVIILAPSHFYGFDGASVWTKGAFQTPLGVVAVDEDFAAKLSSADAKFSFDRKAYDQEHALEVEIPFLQQTFKDFKIVPVILGQMSFGNCQKLAKAIDSLMGDRPDVLVVISSDMSHYHDGNTARAMDLGTLDIIKSLDARNFYKQCALREHEMCGFIPVTTALLLAQERGWEAKILKYAHSGDVTGDNSRVVGYGAVIFYPKGNKDSAKKGAAALNQDQKKKLLQLARQSIELYVTKKKVVDIVFDDPRLSWPEGAFVTIMKNGQLRGCIGHIVTEEPLQKTVRDVAIAAATEDPRFPAVRVDELKDLNFDISVLSLPWRIHNVDEIQLGVHGVIVGQGRARGVFLPQVATETKWSKEKFLSELCSQKAGLPGDCWKDPETVIEIFTADVFGEKDNS